MSQKSRAITTIACVGVVAYICADVIHEVLGHGLTSLVAGSEIKLLTSVHFRSSPDSFVIDLGGPIMNLVSGVLIYLFLQKRSGRATLWTFLLITIMTYNLFWFSGTLVQSSFSQTGDWVYTIEKLNIGILARPMLAIAGIIAYYLSIKFIKSQFSSSILKFSGISVKQSIYYSYFFATVAATIPGLFYSPNRVTASMEGVLEMIGSLVVLFIKPKYDEDTKQIDAKPTWIFYTSVCFLFAIFCLTLGRGFY